MYDLLAISNVDLAADISAVAAVGVFLGSLLGRLFNYVLRIQEAISEVRESIVEVKGRTKAIEDRAESIEREIRTINGRLFEG